jgi:hypothetical protein
VEDYLATNGKPANVEGLWHGHADQEVFALAGYLKPDSNYGAAAFSLANVAYMRSWAAQIAHLKPGMVFFAVPDHLLTLPRVMEALYRSPDRDLASLLGDAQPMPRSTNRPLRCIVREDKDQEFTISLLGHVAQKDGFAVQVYGPDNALVTTAQVPRGIVAPFRIKIPKDGKTGQYIIFLGAMQKDHLIVPITPLPEVYSTNGWTGDNDDSQYFTRSATAQPIDLQIKPHLGPGAILSADGKTTLAQTETGEVLKAEVGSAGAWIYNQTTYIGPATNEPSILSTSPARWFMPDKDKLELPGPPLVTPAYDAVPEGGGGGGGE